MRLFATIEGCVGFLDEKRFFICFVSGMNRQWWNVRASARFLCLKHFVGILHKGTKVVYTFFGSLNQVSGVSVQSCVFIRAASSDNTM